MNARDSHCLLRKKRQEQFLIEKSTRFPAFTRQDDVGTVATVDSYSLGPVLASGQLDQQVHVVADQH